MQGMKKLLDDVAAFHRATDLPVLESPRLPKDRVDLRTNLILEEAREFIDALIKDDVAEVADALADLIYVAVGAALEFGIPLDRVWNAVHRSNMLKIDPATGKVRKREDGKVLKPEGWQPPDIRSALGL